MSADLVKASRAAKLPALDRMDQTIEHGINPWTVQPLLIIDVGDLDGRKVIAPDAVLVLP